MTHPSHKTRISDSSIYDEICTLCGATDARGGNRLNEPCPKAESKLDLVPPVPAALADRPLVIIESPYRGLLHVTYDYLRRALRHSWDAGELPFASHAYFPMFLSENVERDEAIRAGYRFWTDAKVVAFYADLGWTEGMQAAYNHATMLNLPTQIRSIGAHS